MPLGAASPMSGYGGLEKMEPGMVEQMKMHPESAYFYNVSNVNFVEVQIFLIPMRSECIACTLFDNFSFS